MAEYVNEDKSIIFKNGTESDFKVGVGIVFQKSGIYEISINDKITTVTKVSKRKTGRWIFDKNDYLTKCSECGCHPWFGVIPAVKEATKKLPHCPMCLAKMEENDEDR